MSLNDKIYLNHLLVVIDYFDLYYYFCLVKPLTIEKNIEEINLINEKIEKANMIISIDINFLMKMMIFSFIQIKNMEKLIVVKR